MARLQGIKLLLELLVLLRNGFWRMSHFFAVACSSSRSFTTCLWSAHSDSSAFLKDATYALGKRFWSSRSLTCCRWGPSYTLLRTSSNHRHEVRRVLEFTQVQVLVYAGVTLQGRHHLHHHRRLTLGRLGQVHHAWRTALEISEEVFAGMHALANVHTAETPVPIPLVLVRQVIV